jgi:hypothetical protein
MTDNFNDLKNPGTLRSFGRGCREFFPKLILDSFGQSVRHLREADQEKQIPHT